MPPFCVRSDNSPAPNGARLRGRAWAALWLGLSLLLAACEQSGTIDERREYPPFTLRATGGWNQALWGPRHEMRLYTVTYQGKTLRFAEEARDGQYFDWCQPLPGGRLLLAVGGDTLARGHLQAGFRLYQLRLAATGPGLDRLGPNCPVTPRIPDQPALWLTPDSLFLLLPTPDSLGLLEDAAYRLYDLRQPGRAQPVPPTPLTPDSVRREISRITYAPAQRRLTRVYSLAGTAEELVEQIDLPTGRRRFYQRPDTAYTPRVRPVAGRSSDSL